MTSPSTLETGAVLAAARRARADADAAEVQMLLAAVEWARLHEVDADDDRPEPVWQKKSIPLGGAGVPLVDEFCVAELAAAVGMSSDAGRRYLEHALEIAYRLPQVFARVKGGGLQVWRARRIAEKTLPLSPEAAVFVDAQVATAAHKIGITATERLVDQAIARFMPRYAEEIAQKAEEDRYLTVERGQFSFTGTARIHGELDMADAFDLDDALARGAEHLKALGSGDSLEVRRAIALGHLARGDLPQAPGPMTLKGRDLVLYTHLSDNSNVVELENGGRQLLTVEQIKAWCGTATSVTIKPVLDLGAPITSVGYQPSDTLREQVTLRDRTCAHPYCTRPARGCDCDHVAAYSPDAGPCQTCSENLAPLCRHHHRLKTHAGWVYTTLEPGTYLWRSPHGYRFLRDRLGTTDLTPRPVEPPGRGDRTRTCGLLLPKQAR